MKSTLDLRPVYHHLERRIRAHVLLCWLGLLLIRLAETATAQQHLAQPAPPPRPHAPRHLHRGGWRCGVGWCRCPQQAAILRALKLPEPPQFAELTPHPA